MKLIKRKCYVVITLVTSIHTLLHKSMRWDYVQGYRNGFRLLTIFLIECITLFRKRRIACYLRSISTITNASNTSPSLMSLKFSIVIPHSYPCAKRITTLFLPFDLNRLYLTLGITVKASVRVYGMDYDMELRSLITQITNSAKYPNIRNFG